MKPCRYIINTSSRPLLKNPRNILSAVVYHPVYPVFSRQLCSQSVRTHPELHTFIVQLVPLRENHGKCQVVVSLACEGNVQVLSLWKQKMKKKKFVTTQNTPKTIKKSKECRIKLEENSLTITLQM